MSALEGVPALRDRPLVTGERWIYSAGFNVGTSLRDTSRIDVEVPDLRRLADAGARVSVLSHQGDPQLGTAGSLEHVAEHLARALGRPVGYCPTAIGGDAVTQAEALRPGEIVLFGNTRHHPGEQANDPALAREFARLGQWVAVGGFSKAHRAHTSNVGILAHRSGWATDGLLREAEFLTPWATASADRRVAVLGGTKSEKTLIGLRYLADRVDLIVPGGAVLHAVLAARGFPIGASARSDDWDACVAAAREVAESPCRARLHVPRTLVVARYEQGASAGHSVPTGAPVPRDHAIMDFTVEPWALETLAGLERGGRALLAGPPTRYVDGFQTAVGALLPRLRAAGSRVLFLGGDTAAELPWDGPVSTGGGSALSLLAHGSCAVFDALRRHAQPDTARRSA